MHLFSDRGTPYSYRHMNGYSGHTYKFTKPDGTFNYIQIHCKTDLGSKTFTNAEAGKMASENPDHHTQDLFDSIEKGDYPSWTCYVQVLSPTQAEKFRWNIFDLTKIWPQKDVPLRKFGKFTLNRNPDNYFAEIEQVAFSPSHMVPGVEPSADPVLQSRLFSYPDTHRHRLGVNYQQIPVNQPLRAFNPYQRDGLMAVNGNYGANPSYPSKFFLIFVLHCLHYTDGSTYLGSFRSMTYRPVKPSQEHEKWAGAAVTQQIPVTDEDFVQPNGLWEVLGRQPGQQDNFVDNVAGHLYAAREPVRRRTYEMFRRINKTLGARIERETEKLAPHPASQAAGVAQARL